MPQTASKEGKKDIKKRGRGGKLAGGGGGEVWKCFRREKRPLREYMLMQSQFDSFARLVL